MTHLEAEAPLEASKEKPQLNDALYASAMDGAKNLGTGNIDQHNEDAMALIKNGTLPPFQIEGLGKDQDGHDKALIGVYDKQPISTEQRLEAAKEAQNAKEQFPGLMKKSGAEARGADGMTMAELKALAARDDLTPKERAAVNYMMDKENYEALQTGGWRFNDRITAKSLNDYSKDATNVPGKFEKPSIFDILKPQPGQERPKDGTADTGRPGELPGRGRPGERPIDRRQPAEQTSPGNRADDWVKDLEKWMAKNKDIEVKPGWGWSHAAKESLARDGKPNTPANNTEEQKRLRKANPGVETLHPNTKLKRPPAA
jgi:hypothetical protein